MAQIYNTDLSKELIQGASIQVNRDLVPNQLAEKVVPVMEVNPEILRKINWVVVNTVSATGGAVTILTAEPNFDYFITNISMSFVKNVTCDVATGVSRVTAILDGAVAAIGICNAAILTATAERIDINISFPRPLKIKRNSIIGQDQLTFTAGAATKTVTIYGYKIYNQIQ